MTDTAILIEQVRRPLDALLYRTPNSTLVPDWREDMARDALAALSELEERLTALRECCGEGNEAQEKLEAAERERDEWIESAGRAVQVWEAREQKQYERVRELEEALREAVDVAIWLTGAADLTDVPAWPEMSRKLDHAFAALEAKEEK